jgi:hypothetical protein
LVLLPASVVESIYYYYYLPGGNTYFEELDNTGFEPGSTGRTIRNGEATQQMWTGGLLAPLPNYQDAAAFLHVDTVKGLLYLDQVTRTAAEALGFLDCGSRVTRSQVQWDSSSSVSVTSAFISEKLSTTCVRSF